MHNNNNNNSNNNNNNNNNTNNNNNNNNAIEMCICEEKNLHTIYIEQCLRLYRNILKGYLKNFVQIGRASCRERV